MKYTKYKTMSFLLFVLFASIVKAENYRENSFNLMKEAIRQGQELNCVVPIEMSDTASVVANIPIFCMTLPDSIYSIDSYRSLLSLVDFTEDGESQIVIIKKGSDYLTMNSTIGLRKRWWDTLYGEYSRIIPSERITFNTRFGYEDRRFSIDNLLSWMALNPDVELFSIYGVKGLFYLQNDLLFRVNFDKKKKVIVEDAQKYYEKNILKNGVVCICNIIVGGYCLEYDRMK